MGFQTLVLLLFSIALATVDCNIEGDALHSLKTSLTDPNNVLQSWDPTLINPCTWFHVSCNNDNAVIRVDLGNAGLSGSLVPDLAYLTKLQYLELFGNQINGRIPAEIGKLTDLISLGLQQNQLSGPIPSSLGKLKSLRFMRLQGNRLSGTIPTKVIQLVLGGNLMVMNVSDNLLTGTVRSSQAKGFLTTSIVQDPKAPK